MRKLISISTVLFQLFITFGVLFVTYIIFALFDMDEFDLIREGAFLIFQPIFGIILSILTIIVCAIVGLPIRLIPKVYSWWSSKPVLAFACVTIGIILMFLSLNVNFTETAQVTIDGEERSKEIPNSCLVVTGWFLSAFSLLHFYPMPLIKWFKNKVWTKATNRDVSSLM